MFDGEGSGGRLPRELRAGDARDCESREVEWLRARQDCGIVVVGKNLFPKHKENRMVNLAQVIKDLRAERSEAQKAVDRLEKAIGALQKLGNPGPGEQTNETRTRRKLSAAARKRISQAQKARWAKIRRQKAVRA